MNGNHGKAWRGNCAAVLIVLAIVLACAGLGTWFIHVAWDVMGSMTTWLLGD